MLGGQSNAELSFKDGAMRLTGFISAKAGFASFAGVTVSFFNSDFEGYDFSRYSGITLKVKGDGKKYRLTVNSQKIIDYDDFTAVFKTEKDKFIDIKIPFSELKQTGFGEKLEWNGKDIYGVSILTFGNMNKKFNIEVDKIELY